MTPNDHEPNGQHDDLTGEAPGHRSASRQPPTKTRPRRRSRARRNVVGSSPHCSEYEALMEAGWSSLAIERYAAFRFGEDVPARTIRQYRQRRGIGSKGEPFEDSEPVDVLQLRADLIRLQLGRIAIDVEHEQEINKLFGSTRNEIRLLAELLTEHKVDLQDVGLLPKAGETVEIRTPQRPSAVPQVATLGELVGVESGGEQEMQLAKVLHLRMKDQAGNGQAS